MDPVSTFLKDFTLSWSLKKLQKFVNKFVQIIIFIFGFFVWFLIVSEEDDSLGFTTCLI